MKKERKGGGVEGGERAEGSEWREERGREGDKGRERGKGVSGHHTATELST